MVALERELRAVARAMGARVHAGLARGRLGGREVAAVAVGLGGDPRAAIRAEHPALVVSCGFAGALSPSLRAGDLVVATAVRAAGGERLHAPDLPVARAFPEAVRGEIACAERVLATPEEKRALGTGGAVAVDLESAQVARAAVEAGVPWLVLRAIVDDARTSLPAFAREARTDFVWPALRHALHGPSAVVELWQLAMAERAASASLSRALKSLGAAPAVKALVTGASGFIGGAVARTLLGGARESACCFGPAPRPTYPTPRLSSRARRPARPRIAPRGGAGCTAIFHVGALYSFAATQRAAGHQRRRHAQRGRAARAGRRRVYTSSIATMGGMRGDVVPDERQEARAVRRPARTRRASGMPSGSCGRRSSAVSTR